jgi:hypothetical protein
MLPECRHILPSGYKCTALALRGKYYCYFHTRLHTLAAKPALAPDEPLKLPSSKIAAPSSLPSSRYSMPSATPGSNPAVLASISMDSRSLRRMSNANMMSSQ